VRDGVFAALFAGLLSGVPSTLYAVLTRTSVLHAISAAGGILLGSAAPQSQTLFAGALVHGFLSLFWGVVLGVVLPRRATVLWGGVAAVAIAVLDLLIIGRMFASINALPFLPQLFDHIVFGIVAAIVISQRRKAR
jgi:hypothetical protein